MAQTSTAAPSAFYRIDPLKPDNWPQWKRRSIAIFRDRSLLEYIDGTSKCPGFVDPAAPKAEEKTAITAWQTKDGSAQTQIELSISDAEMVHIIDAKTAREMWTQLCAVKEARGAMGILGARRKFYRITMEEGADMVVHIAELRQIQSDIHVMGSKIGDDEFMAVLATSLPESWDSFTQAYFGATGGISIKDPTKTITSHELGAVLIDEDKRRRDRGGGDSALYVRGKQPNKWSGGGRSNDQAPRTSTGVECFNCKKKGHIKADCWSTGGGKEGQRPNLKKKTERANVATSGDGASAKDLQDFSYCTQDKEQALAIRENPKRLWYADTGASSHLATDLSMFSSYRSTPNEVVIGVGGATPIAGRGTVELACIVNENETKIVTLENVMHVPTATCCLLSVGRLDEAGGSMEISRGGCRLRDKKGTTIAEGTKSGRMYLVKANAVNERANAASDEAISWDEWHKRFAHTGNSGIERMVSSNSVTGLIIDPNSTPSHNCEACIQAKHERRSFPREREHGATRKGELTHTDLWGPSPKASLGKANYYISFTDDFTRFGSIGFLSKKGQAIDHIQKYIAWVETQAETVAKAIRSDKGGEFTSDALKNWAATKGIELQNTAPYSPEQNGVAERRNRTYLELARAILLEKDLPLALCSDGQGRVGSGRAG